MSIFIARTPSLSALDAFEQAVEMLVARVADHELARPLPALADLHGGAKLPGQLLLQPRDVAVGRRAARLGPHRRGGEARPPPFCVAPPKTPAVEPPAPP